jgi:membrane protease YdiL (CAAX protease family)
MSGWRELRDGLVEPLREAFGAKEWFLGLGTLVIVCLWLSFGSPAFFTETFGARFAGDPYLDWYQYAYYHVCAFVLLAVVPLVVLRVGFGVRPRDVGVQLGDWRWGLRFVGVGVVVATPLVYLSAMDPAFQAEYPLTKLAGQSLGTWVLWELTYLVYYVGWEVYFRGALLFGLQERLGTGGALLFQTAISTLVHIGKPVGELIGAAPAGLIFGAAALRSRSILWPLLLHAYLGALMDVCAYCLGAA